MACERLLRGRMRLFDCAQITDAVIGGKPLVAALFFRLKDMCLFVSIDKMRSHILLIMLC
jgi:hypothetical protein